MIYLKEQDLKKIKDILNKYPFTFYAFGSRATGHHRELSNLNLCFMEEISTDNLASLEKDFKESNIEFIIDIIDYNLANEDFKNNIRKDLMIFHMGNSYIPHKDVAYPLFGIDNYHSNKLCFLKNIVQNKNIIIGDYSYYHDLVDIYNFEKNVLYHFDIIGDKLIIGKFCQIASDVKFIMNGSSHSFEGPSTYPFGVFVEPNSKNDSAWKINHNFPYKGDTIIENDIWIGYNSTIMPGIKIGNGAIIAANSHVTKDVEAYSMVGGNPAQLIRKRFDDETIEFLQNLKWWDWPIEVITENLQELVFPELLKKKFQKY